METTEAAPSDSENGMKAVLVKGLAQNTRAGGASVKGNKWAEAWVLGARGRMIGRKGPTKPRKSAA